MSAKKRTKKQKQQARKKRVYQSKTEVIPADQSHNLIHFNTQLIIKDLLRSAIATGVVFGVLVALYFWL